MTNGVERECTHVLSHIMYTTDSLMDTHRVISIMKTNSVILMGLHYFLYICWQRMHSLYAGYIL